MNNNDSDIAALRTRHRRARSVLTASQLSDSASALVNQVAQVFEFADCRRVASYIAIRGEIDTLPLMQRFVDKHYYLPVLRGTDMYFAQWQPGSTLLKKDFGLLEPDCTDDVWIDSRELDVVLVPLVVFDRNCNRIGQGGGFYDRAFEFLKGRAGVGKPALVGVAHESQREPELQPQSWDVPLDLRLPSTEETEVREYRSGSVSGSADRFATDHCVEVQSGGRHIAQYFYYLFWRFCPTHCCGINFLERMYDALIVQRNIGFSECGELPGIKCCIPLFVLVAKAHHSDIALCDQVFCSNTVDLG